MKTQLFAPTTIMLLLVSQVVSGKSNTGTQFIGLDRTAETNLCIRAAKEGFDAVKTQVKEAGELTQKELATTICNGLTIKRFAKKFTRPTRAQSETIHYQFKPLDDSSESRICAIAAEKGLSTAIKVGGQEVRGLICNGKDIAYFARQYSND